MAEKKPVRWQKPAAEFSDALGTYMEVTGHPRLTGRLMGWLLVCEPAAQSALELAGALGVSRSAISAATQQAVRHGIVERVAVPGSREVHFRIAEDAVSQPARASLPLIQQLRKAADRTLEALAERPAEKNRRLAQMRDFYGFIEREIPSLLDRWEEEQRRKG